MLKDSSGRQINYARISLTDRCNMRCRYCMPEAGVEKLSHGDIMTYEEISKLAGLLRELGIKKIRFTGGEPFVRKGAMDFFERLEFHFHITTNLTAPGLDIARLNRLNLGSINVSCDSLRPDRYAGMTGGGRLDVFLSNFEKLKIGDRKINVVMIKGFNEDEAEDFVEFASRHGASVRFIEKMNFIDDKLGFVPAEVIEQTLINRGIIEKESSHSPGSTARYHGLKNKPGRVGFITPLSAPFCGNCGRIRIKSDGALKLCIFDRANFGLREVLASGDGEAVAGYLRECIEKKKAEPAVRSGGEEPACVGG